VQEPSLSPLRSDTAFGVGADHRGTPLAKNSRKISPIHWKLIHTSMVFTCPACGQPDLHFHNIMKRGKLIERRVRCTACGYSRPITWKEKRSLLVQAGIAKEGRRAKSRAQGS
jgi:ssDNA-binding Zn-finger/Zn-ribbon topoisomerase 1